MDIRNVTIWATGLVLIVTVIFPYLLICIDVTPFHGFGAIGAVILIWGCSSSLLMISLMIAKRLKHDFPALLLFGSTFVYVTIAALTLTYWLAGCLTTSVSISIVSSFDILGKRSRRVLRIASAFFLSQTSIAKCFKFVGDLGFWFFHSGSPKKNEIGKSPKQPVFPSLASRIACTQKGGSKGNTAKKSSYLAIKENRY